MGLSSWLKERKEEKAEVKAAEKAAFEEHKGVAKAERQRKAIEEATAKGKEKAYTKPGLPKLNPKKIAAIKKGLSKAADKAAKAHERMGAGEMDKFSAIPEAPEQKRSVTVKKIAAKKKKSVKASATDKKRAVKTAIKPIEKSPAEHMSDYEKKMKEALGY